VITICIEWSAILLRLRMLCPALMLSLGHAVRMMNAQNQHFATTESAITAESVTIATTVWMGHVDPVAMDIRFTNPIV